VQHCPDLDSHGHLPADNPEEQPQTRFLIASSIRLPR
jgi:hypothetical protein